MKRTPITTSPAASASWLGRWFTAVRRAGLLATVPAEAWHTLCAILSFTTRDGTRPFTLDQLALSLGLSREAARDRLTQLAAVQWRDQPLATIERDAAGDVTGATLAPVELLASVAPGPEDAASGDALPATSSDLVARLRTVGLEDTQIEHVTRDFSPERISRQLDWLPGRHARNPAALLLRAIEQDWKPPTEGA